MRILIITTFFPPQNSIASHRPFSWAKYWSLAGNEITVVTTPKNSDDESALNFGNSNFDVVELPFGKTFERLRSIYRKDRPSVKQTAVMGEKPVRKTSLLRKMLGLLDNYRRRSGVFDMRRFPDFSHFWVGNVVSWASENGPWDLVVSTYAPYTTHLAGYRLKKKGVAKFWVADYRDLWTDDHIFKGIPVLRFYERSLERKLVSEADMLTSVSDPLCDKLYKRFGKDCINIQNGYEPEDLESIPARNIFQELPNKKRIVYTGSIYKSTRDPSPLFQAIALIAESEDGKILLEDLEVIFVGGNSDVLDEMIAHYGVSKWVKLGGLISRQEALMMQRDADILLFLESNANGVEGILTGKIFEYISSGTEIWALGVTQDSSPGRLLVSCNCGKVFANDMQSIYVELLSLLKGKHKIKSNIEFDSLFQYTREALALKMLNKIKSGMRIG